MTGIESLRETLGKDIHRLDEESTKHKRLHRKCQAWVIVLTAATTVVAGAGLVLPNAADNLVQFAVLCLSATTAAVAAWSEMRRARELWQHERETYYALIDIQRGMEFMVANKDLTPDDLNAIFEKINAVLGSSAQKWARIQEKKDG